MCQNNSTRVILLGGGLGHVQGGEEGHDLLLGFGTFERSHSLDPSHVVPCCESYNGKGPLQVKNREHDESNECLRCMTMKIRQ